MPFINSKQRQRAGLREQAAAALALDSKAPDDRLAFALVLVGGEHSVEPRHVTAALAIASAPIFGDYRPLRILADALQDLADGNQPNRLLHLGLSPLAAELALKLTLFARRQSRLRS